jgi:hypothetical protein
MLESYHALLYAYEVNVALVQGEHGYGIIRKVAYAKTVKLAAIAASIAPSVSSASETNITILCLL